MKRLSSVLIALGLTALICAAPAAARNDPPQHVSVKLCHATHSSTNPYVEITVDDDSVQFRAHDSHQDNEDIIPAFTFTDGTRYPGKNLHLIHILNNGCEVPQSTTTSTTVGSTTTTTAPTTTTLAPTTTTTEVRQSTTTTLAVTTTTVKSPVTTSTLPSVTTPGSVPSPPSPLSATPITTTSQDSLPRTGVGTVLLLIVGALLVAGGLLGKRLGRQ